MKIELHPDTLLPLDAEMARGGYASHDELIHTALENLRAVAAGVPLEDLDPETLAVIRRAEGQSERGEGVPAEACFEEIRRKYLGSPDGSANRA